MIYICIPTYNEQQTVGVVLWKLKQVLTEFPRDYQLLVADDASTDKTPDVLEPYTRVLPLTVIRADRRMGQAACMEMLLREAVRRSEYPKRDIVITLQADFSEEPDDIVPMIKRIEAGADVAVGNKVSVSKPHWKWRLARRLGGLFAAGQAWPEGVATPFDGYRAYRLYGVKRALEERPNRRLLRYDGWAGAAELLRAVLPHARRVDVIDVEARPDRLQRPRRERPLSSAMQVRPMMKDIEPPGLVTVDVLDALVATASRARASAAQLERAASLAQRAGNGRREATTRRSGESTRARGGRQERTRTDERRPRTGAGRSSAAAEGGDPRARRTAAEGGDSRARRTAAEGGEPRARRAAAEGGESRPRRKPAERPAPQRPKGPTAAEETAATPSPEAAPHGDPLEGLLPVAEAEGTEQARPKRRRRRGRRGRGGAGAGAGAASADGSAPEAGPAGEVTDAGPVQGGEGGEAAGERAGDEPGMSESGAAKRRRRGGRRGGRGRRRGPAAPQGGESAGTDGGESAESRAPVGELAAGPPRDTNTDE